jgi:hypothetical protein
MKKIIMTLLGLNLTTNLFAASNFNIAVAGSSGGLNIFTEKVII